MFDVFMIQKDYILYGLVNFNERWMIQTQEAC